MKICPKCKKKYDDDFSFCNNCGCKLEQNSAKLGLSKNTIIVGSIIFVSICSIIFFISEKNSIYNARKEIQENKYNKELAEYRNKPTISDIKVNSDWTTRKSGSYIYITGSVTNTSSTKTISYYEVEAKFYDSFGNIIDSDWTNDGDDLEPGESRKFEIMHKYSYDEEDIRLSIKEVD